MFYDSGGGRPGRARVGVDSLDRRVTGVPGRSALTATIAFVLVSLLAACGSAGPQAEGDPFASGERDESVRLVIQNMNFSDARIYTLTRGARRSLGVVGGKQDAEFTIDWSVPEPLQLEIHLLAGPQCYTREILVDPGDILEMQISAVFTDSAACR